MISELLRRWAGSVLAPVARVVGRTGVSPNGLTLLGLAANVVVAGVLATGRFQLGGVLVLLAGAFDALDGAVARSTGRVTVFGGFLDSTLDRVSEVALYFGLLYFYTQRNAAPEILLIYLTIAGSLLVSYTRARAEGAGLECKVGAFTRLERVLVLAFGLLLQQMTTALVILTVGTALTVAQRVLHVARQSRETDR
jgi:CDP-diacylglycerol--glycerol-3-phosphate 3-phosphatidyltransferase